MKFSLSDKPSIKSLKMKPVDLSLKETSELFTNHHKIKVKVSCPYVTRCEMEKRDGSSPFGDTADLLFIDGDKPLPGKEMPTLLEVSAVLSAHNIIHFGATTFSHTEEAPRYRITIPCEYNIDQLEPTIAALFQLIHGAGLSLHNSTENSNWKQAWFLPSYPKERAGIRQNVSVLEGKWFDACTVDDIPENTNPILCDHSESEVVDIISNYQADEYDIWVKVGMAVKAWNPVEGKAIWDKWSESYPGYSIEDQNEKWQSFNKTTGGMITLDSLKKRNAIDDLLADYIFLRDSDTYLNVNTKTTYSPAVLNKVMKRVFTGQRRTDSQPAIPLAVTAYHHAAGAEERSTEGLIFLPIDKEIVKVEGVAYANTYKGLQITPVDGDVSEYLALVHFLCGEYADHVLDHMAFTIQKPGSKIRWQILLSGHARTGKSLMFQVMTRIFGTAASVVDPTAGGTAFDDIFCQKKVVIMEEVYRPECRTYFNEIKAKLANSDIELLNPKKRSMITQRNLYSIYMSTNHADALAFDANDDKLLVITTPDSSQRWEAERYVALGQAIEGVKNNDYAGRILNFLLNRDISKFSDGRLPVRTEAAEAMALAGRPDYAVALEEMVATEEYPFNDSLVTLAEVRAALKNRKYNFSDRCLSKALKDLGFESYKGQKKILGKTTPSTTYWSRGDNLIGKSPSELYTILEAKKAANNWHGI